MMPVVYPIGCGLDVHQAQRTVCLRRVTAEGQVTQEVRECATTYPALLTLLDGLHAAQCPVVAMESTGVYWRPVSHVLIGTVAVLVGNAHEMRRRPGRKTDKADARWIAALLAHDLSRPSCIPPPALQALRALPARARRWSRPGRRPQTGSRRSWRIRTSSSPVWWPTCVGPVAGACARRCLRGNGSPKRWPRSPAGADGGSSPTARRWGRI